MLFFDKTIFLRKFVKFKVRGPGDLQPELVFWRLIMQSGMDLCKQTRKTPVKTALNNTDRHEI